MPDKKRRTAAQKQRARARRERVARTAPPPARADGRQAPAPARRRRRRRSSRSIGTGAIVTVFVVIGVMVLLFLTRSDSGPAARGSTAAVRKAQNVPASTLEAVGDRSDIRPPNALPAGTPPVEIDGKPAVVYIGAEYCPFCAAERWPVVVALSRFGTFSDLGTTSSAPPPETLPNTPTFSFHGASYTSDHIAFSAAETETRDFKPLDTLTAQQQRIFSTYNVPAVTGSSGAIPFVMVGNLYAWAGASFDTSVFEGLTFDQIADRLSDPNSRVAQQIDGAANEITAMVCKLTGDRPSDVCSAPYIQQAGSALPSA